MARIRTLIFDDTARLCTMLHAQDGVLLCPDNHCAQLARSAAAGAQALTFQQVWTRLDEQYCGSVRALNKAALSAWLAPHIDDIPALRHVTGSSAVSQLATHLMEIDLAGPHLYQPQGEIEAAMQELRQRLAQADLATSPGYSHLLADQAHDLDLGSVQVHVQGTRLDPAQWSLLRGLSSRHEVTVYALDPLMRGDYDTHTQDMRTGHLSSTLDADDLYADAQASYIIAHNESDSAAQEARRLIQEGHTHEQLLIVVPNVAAWGAHMQAAAERYCLPLYMHQGVRARDTAITSLMLALAQKPTGPQREQLLSHYSSVGITRSQIQALSENGAARIRDIYELGHTLHERSVHAQHAPSKLTEAWLQSLHQTLSWLPEGCDPVHVLEGVSAAGVLVGDPAGIELVSYEQAPDRCVHTALYCGLSADAWPSHETSPFAGAQADERLPHLRAPAHLDTLAKALTCTQQQIYIRSAHSSNGEPASPSLMWLRLQKKLPAQPRVDTDLSYTSDRHVLRARARRQESGHPLIDEALSRMHRDTLPSGHLQGRHTRYSVTELELFLSCPYGWFVKHVLRPSSQHTDPAAARGQWLHELCAGVFAPDVLPTARIDRLHVLWEEAEQRRQELLSGAQDTVYLQRMRNMIERYGPQDWPWKEHHVEVDLEGAILPAVPHATICGRADRVDSAGPGLLVIDYKNRRSLQRPADSKTVTSLQDTLYPLLAQHQFSQPAAGMLYVSIYHQDHAGLLAQRIAGLDNGKVSFDLLPTLTERAQDAATDAILRIEAGDVTQIGTGCSAWCPHRMLSQTGQGR